MGKLKYLILFPALAGLFLAFQNCAGDIHLNRVDLSSGKGSPGSPGSTTTTLPVDYKYFAVGASTFNNPQRTGVVFLNIGSKVFQFFDLGPQWSGNVPFSAVVYDDANISRLAVSQPISIQSPSQGSVYLVEINKATLSKTNLLQETNANDRYSYFLRSWGDCDGDGKKDWIQSYGNTYMMGIYCRSSVTGAIIKTLASPNTNYLYRALNKDVDGDGIPDIVMEGPNDFAVLGSKTNTIILNWTTPTAKTGYLTHYPDYFDVDGDGWNEILIRNVNLTISSSYYIYSMKKNMQLAEIKVPAGVTDPSSMQPINLGKFLPGTALQIVFYINNTLYIFNTDGTEAGRFTEADFFNAFSSMSPKPSCWVGCANPIGFSTMIGDLDKDGYNDMIVMHPDYLYFYSIKNKTSLASVSVSIGTYINNWFADLFLLP